MAEGATTLEVIIRRYREQLEAIGIHCDEVLLYGSHAHGKASEGSDIDLIVISEDWQRYSPRERLEVLGVAAARILEPIQAVGFTPLEVEQQEMLPFWLDIIQHASKAA